MKNPLRNARSLLSTVISLVTAAFNLQDDRITASFRNYTKADGKGSFPFHGGVTVYLNEDASSQIRIAWNLLSKRLGASLNISDDAELSASVSLPPVSLYFASESWSLLSPLSKRTGSREVSFSVHDGSVWWKAGANPNEWRDTDPRWQQGNFDVISALFGKEQVIHEEVGTPQRVKVPMPEGAYDATCTLKVVRVSRPRSPFSASYRMANVEMDTGIPIPGKGEDAWNCDEDAIHSQSAPAHTTADAIANVVSSALRQRQKYGGLGWMPTTHTTSPVAQA